MPPDLPNYDPPSGPVPTPAATRFDRVSEPPVRSHLLPEDDAKARMRELPRYNSAVVGAVGTDLLTVRVDLDVGRA